MTIRVGGNVIAGTNLSAFKNNNIGEIITSTIPLSDAGLHLLDGGVISGSGAYSAFVTYIAGLVSGHSELFTTEANWQTSVTNYGVCGKFVYDSVNNTVRLPKITGFTEGTIDPTVLGDLTQAGLPNITGAFYRESGSMSNNASGGSNADHTELDASRSSSIYGNSTTVQPQSIKILYYIVIATSAKTNIEVDIDEVMSDLNLIGNPNNYDGQWGSHSLTLATEATPPTTDDIVFDLSSYLPNDGYKYEVLLNGIAVTGTTSGNSQSFNLTSDIIRSNIRIARVNTRTSSSLQASGSAIIPVGIGRYITYKKSAANTGTFNLYLNGYRRIGTNS